MHCHLWTLRNQYTCFNSKMQFLVVSLMFLELKYFEPQNHFHSIIAERKLRRLKWQEKTEQWRCVTIWDGKDTKLDIRRQEFKPNISHLFAGYPCVTDLYSLYLVTLLSTSCPHFSMKKCEWPQKYGNYKLQVWVKGCSELDEALTWSSLNGMQITWKISNDPPVSPQFTTKKWLWRTGHSVLQKWNCLMKDNKSPSGFQNSRNNCIVPSQLCMYVYTFLMVLIKFIIKWGNKLCKSQLKFTSKLNFLSETMLSISKSLKKRGFNNNDLWF